MENMYRLRWGEVSEAVRERIRGVRGPDEACWRWPGTTHTSGYGVISMGSRQSQQYAHRVAWVVAHEAGLLDGTIVAHTCDEPACVNPAHLVATTQQWNMQNKMAKGRGNHRRGEAHPQVKLSDATVAEIRRRWDEGADTQIAMAREFGVWPGTISKIVRGTARVAR